LPFLFVISAPVAAIFHIVPIFLPLFSPCKWLVTGYANFGWKIFPFNAFHFYRFKN